MAKKLNLKDFRDVHEEFRIDNVSPADLRELWFEAKKELLKEIKNSLIRDEEGTLYFPLTKLTDLEDENKLNLILN